MDFSEISRQNPWWKNASEILNDEKIRQLDAAKIPWHPRLKYFIKFDRDKIYTLRGPRQVGKTTLCKTLIRDLIADDKDPKGILYYSCDLVSDEKELFDVLGQYISWSSVFNLERKYVFLDEISSVKDWEKGLKHMVDTGFLKDTSIMLTGSHSIDIKKSIERLPGRRGEGDETIDKILLPMKFAEFAETVSPSIKSLFEENELWHNSRRQEILQGLFEGEIDPLINVLRLYQDDLDTLFDQYLITGGIPKPINEFFSDGNINNSTYEIYVRSLMGDLARWQIPEIAVKQILRALFRRLTTNVSWQGLVDDTDIGSHNTISKYVQSLESSFVLNILYAVDLPKKTPQFRKEKKIYPQDPFIFHSLLSWTSGSANYFNSSIEYLANSENKSKLVESVVQSHLVRLMYNMFPSDIFSPEEHIFYWRNKGGKKEVDYVLKSRDNELLPIELKYQNKLQNSDYRGLYSFPKGIMLSKNTFEVNNNYVTIPVSIFLLLV
ncbi:MAG: ATP-binding protein [Methanolobus sp.]|nr:ATP-binding protein [Methanolobus sp.]